VAIRMAGRGLRAPVISCTPGPGGLSIRVDDSRDREVWVEITIDLADLLQLAATAQHQWDCETRAALSVLDSPFQPV